MANEATIFDSFARYNDALLGIQEARFRREDEAAERGRMETIARGIREESRADAKASQLEERIARENELMIQGKLQKEARDAAVKERNDTIAESRKFATQNFNVLDKRIANKKKRLEALQEIDIKTGNFNARRVAQTVVQDRATLDKLFNLGSATDNSPNLLKIPGKENQAQFLYSELAKLNQESLAPRQGEIKALTYELSRDMEHQGEVMRNVALTEDAIASGPEAPLPPLVVSDLAAAAAAFLPGGAETPPAAPTNPGVGVTPGIVRSIFGAGALPAPAPGAMRAAQAAVPMASPGGMQAAESASIWRSPVVAPTTPVNQVFNAPGAPSGAEFQPGSFNMDGIQKIQGMLEEAYGPDSFIPAAEIEPTLQKARQMGWTEQQVEAARGEILGSKNVFGGAYPALLGVWRQSKAMSQGIPAPIQPGQSPGMQFQSGW